ncbi:MAG: DUF4956 domain-containing protein [Acidobacteriota bacterium]|nr:DUF4956 domain-containing protein [Acidobacteriota bacterium]
MQQQQTETNPLADLTATVITNYTPMEMLINMSLALVLGIVTAIVYRRTHKGLAYSQSFTLTIVFVTLIVSIVIMVIGSSLARAFALVGALSIIRFRTVVKDTKDTTFVFAGLAVGLAAGTSNYFLAVAGCIFISIVAIVLYRINFGALYKTEFILRFNFDQQSPASNYLDTITQYAGRANMLHMESAAEGRYLNLTYDIVLKSGVPPEELISAMDNLEGTSEVVLIASKNDVDY